MLNICPIYLCKAHVSALPELPIFDLIPFVINHRIQPQIKNSCIPNTALCHLELPVLIPIPSFFSRLNYSRIIVFTMPLGQHSYC